MLARMSGSAHRCLHQWLAVLLAVLAVWLPMPGAPLAQELSAASPTLAMPAMPGGQRASGVPVGQPADGAAPDADAATIQPDHAQRLRRLLIQDCGSCHGLRMKGGLGPALTVDALRGKSDDMLVAAVLLGRPGTAMPPWQPLLTQAEARWLIAQLKQGIQP